MIGNRTPYEMTTPEVQGQTQTPAPPIPPLPAAPGAATGQAPVSGAGTGAPVSRDEAQQQLREAAANLRTAIQNEIGQAQQGQAVTVVPPPLPRDEIPDEVIPIVGIVFSMVALMVVGTPLARAIARAIDRRSDAARVRAADLAPQLRQLQESVDAMAIEVERISEAQRFTAKLMAERAQALPAGESRQG